MSSGTLAVPPISADVMVFELPILNDDEALSVFPAI